MKMTARDVRYHLKSIMEAVERGEDVVITKRGKPKARIVRLETSKKLGKEENPFVGMWKDRKDLQDVKSYVRMIRRGRVR